MKLAKNAATPLITGPGSEYFFDNRTLRKNPDAREYFNSVNLRIAALAWSTGKEIREITLPIIMAYLDEQPPLARGSTIPFKKAPGLNTLFFSAS